MEVGEERRATDRIKCYRGDCALCTVRVKNGRCMTIQE
jgi:hypothetical protein